MSTTSGSGRTTPPGSATTPCSVPSSGWSRRCRSRTWASPRRSLRSTMPSSAGPSVRPWTGRASSRCAPSGIGDVPADSMVPPGIPGGGARSWLPAHDPALARDLLARAGFAGGVGLPEVTFATGGLIYAEGIAADLERELGVRIHLEELDDHYDRLHEDPPPMWTLGWVADYPGANDFLGVLLGTDSSNNYGGWSSAMFDACDRRRARDTRSRPGAGGLRTRPRGRSGRRARDPHRLRRRLGALKGRTSRRRPERAPDPSPRGHGMAMNGAARGRPRPAVAVAVAGGRAAPGRDTGTWPASPVLPRPSVHRPLPRGHHLHGSATVGGPVQRLEIVVDIEGFTRHRSSPTSARRGRTEPSTSGTSWRRRAAAIVPNTDVTAHFRATLAGWDPGRRSTRDRPLR